MNKLMTQVPVKVLMCISKKNNYLSKVMREIGCTYSHITKIGNKFEELKLINRKKEGRMTEVTLTEKGLKIQEHLNEIKKLL